MSNWWIFVIIIVLLSRRRRQKRVNMALMLRRHRKGKKIMEEMIRVYIGKEVLVYTINQEVRIDGILEDVRDGWLVVKGFENGEMQTVNLEYVTRVREYPHDKNGKRKLLFD